MPLKIETGHPVSGDVKPVEGNRIRFVAEDGQTMFEVTAGKDGRSIEVRAVDTCRVDGVLYNGIIEIHPLCGNSIEIRTQKYQD